MANLYHILYQQPIYNLDGLTYGYEELAKKLIKSGLLRIDAYNKINFARFSVPSKGINRMFNIHELYDKNLLIRTKKIIYDAVKSPTSTRKLDQEIKNHIIYMRKELQKYQPVGAELELQLARLLVQAAHPAIIELILIEKVEVFISYSYTIGDVLDIYSWQKAGDNSGMQSIEGSNIAIFVSCGGDPFAPTETETYGDGQPALARMMIIAGQEIGHYSDLLRNKQGRPVGRFSMNNNGYGGREPVRSFRYADLNHIKELKKSICYTSYFFERLFENERALKFFRQNRKRDLIILITKLKVFFLKLIVNLTFHKKFKVLLSHFNKKPYLSLGITEMLDDMAFNLAPQADVYRNQDKHIEEATLCAEALARVPQQTIKWGPNVTSFVYPKLYRFYYETVVPYNIKVYEELINSKFSFNTIKIRIPFHKKLYSKIKSKLKRSK